MIRGRKTKKIRKWKSRRKRRKWKRRMRCRKIWKTTECQQRKRASREEDELEEDSRRWIWKRMKRWTNRKMNVKDKKDEEVEEKEEEKQEKEEQEQEWERRRIDRMILCEINT